MLQINLLGKFALHGEGLEVGSLPLKGQELLSFLILFANSAHTRESLANEFWAHAPIAQSKKYLRQTLWHLQSFLESSQDNLAEPYLLVNNGSIRFNLNTTAQSDIHFFATTFKQLKDKSGLSLSESEAGALQQSVALYQGDLLAGWYYDWCILQRERYRAMAMAQLDKLVLYCLGKRNYESGIAYGMNVLQIDHSREKTHRQLMRLYYFSGDRTGALRQFEYCKKSLQQEIGVQPTRKTIHLYQQILADAGAAISVDDNTERSIMERSIMERDKPLAEPDGGLIKMLSQIVTDMTSLRADIELLKQSLNNKAN